MTTRPRKRTSSTSVYSVVCDPLRAKASVCTMLLRQVASAFYQVWLHQSLLAGSRSRLPIGLHCHTRQVRWTLILPHRCLYLPYFDMASTVAQMHSMPTARQRCRGSFQQASHSAGVPEQSFPMQIRLDWVLETSCTAIMNGCWQSRVGHGMHMHDVLIYEQMRCCYLAGMFGKPPIGAETDLQFQRSTRDG